MAKDRSVSLRVTRELLQRVDALLPLLARDPEVRVWGEPTRTALLRLAILRGLDALEQRYAPGWTVDDAGASDDERALPVPPGEIGEAMGPPAHRAKPDEFGFTTLFDGIEENNTPPA